MSALTVELFDGAGRQVQVLSATRVMIKDARGTPVALAVVFAEAGKPAYYVTRVGDPDFNDTLQALGVDAVTVRHIGG